jgi:hypothetical protein
MMNVTKVSHEDTSFGAEKDFVLSKSATLCHPTRLSLFQTVSLTMILCTAEQVVRVVATDDQTGEVVHDVLEHPLRNNEAFDHECEVNILQILLKQRVDLIDESNYSERLINEFFATDPDFRGDEY